MLSPRKTSMVLASTTAFLFLLQGFLAMNYPRPRPWFIRALGYGWSTAALLFVLHLPRAIRSSHSTPVRPSREKTSE